MPSTPKQPRRGSFAHAAREIRVLEEASGQSLLTPEIRAALAKVDRALPKDAKPLARAKAADVAQAEAGGYERVTELAQGIVEAGLSFADISPADVAPPVKWVQALGTEEAERKFRLARMAWLPSRESPAGLGIAVDILKMDAKVKAASKTPTAPTLNIAIQMNMSPVDYPEIVEAVDE